MARQFQVISAVSVISFSTAALNGPIKTAHQRGLFSALLNQTKLPFKRQVSSIRSNLKISSLVVRSERAIECIYLRFFLLLAYYWAQMPSLFTIKNTMTPRMPAIGPYQPRSIATSQSSIIYMATIFPIASEGSWTVQKHVLDRSKPGLQHFPTSAIVLG